MGGLRNKGVINAITGSRRLLCTATGWRAEVHGGIHHPRGEEWKRALLLFVPLCNLTMSYHSLL